ncbi:MAG: aldehyde dehydrogenase family protein, partial [Flavobacteriales bacterium]|nr:aldehyde dehydrogenase family protein [Flavobacteriales bacterium]
MGLIKQINPWNGEEIGNFESISTQQGIDAIESFQSEFLKWRTSSLDHRIAQIQMVKDHLLSRKDELARTMSLEMGKPISQSKGEINKCAWLCDEYCSEAKSMLSSQSFQTDYSSSKVVYQPLGLILLIMPWNYPLWQVFRAAVPAILSGNLVVLKHAENVWASAKNLEELFNTNSPLLLNLFMEKDQMEEVIQNKNIKAVSLTGSGRAGSAVASAAARVIKPSVLELGGSNAMIVDSSANLDLATQQILRGRFQNNGQSCIAVKRLICHESVYPELISRLKSSLSQYVPEDPTSESSG